MTARTEQLTPPGDWFGWLFLAGRGAGKTRSGAEDAAKFAVEHPGSRQAVIAPTRADARDTCIEGDSGLESVLSRYGVIKQWNRSLGELTCINGSRFKLFSAEEPERLRGPQHHRAWCEEVAAWERPETWDQMLFGLRLGADPRVIATTTPKPTKLIRSLIAREDIHVTRGSTFDNAAHLAPTALEQLRRRYEGTRLGRQELYAEVLEDMEGALWTWTMLDTTRIQRQDAPRQDYTRVVVALDPAVTSGEDSDMTGIVVVGRGTNGEAYVLEDCSVRDTPDGWCRRAVAAYERWEADAIVAEVNNGGDLVEAVLRTVAPRARYRAVRASRGKHVRAEPVAALWEQGRGHLVGSMPELEEQLTSWTPDSGSSPDRLDALVWGVTEAVLTARRGHVSVA